MSSLHMFRTACRERCRTVRRRHTGRNRRSRKNRTRCLCSVHRRICRSACRNRSRPHSFRTFHRCCRNHRRSAAERHMLRNPAHRWSRFPDRCRLHRRKQQPRTPRNPARRCRRFRSHRTDYCRSTAWDSHRSRRNRRCMWSNPLCPYRHHLRRHLHRTIRNPPHSSHNLP